MEKDAAGLRFLAAIYKNRDRIRKDNVKTMKDNDKSKLKGLIDNYQRSLEKLCFSAPEQKWIQSLTGDEDALDLIEQFIYFSIELNNILENCPDSIYITDEDGITHRVNKTFEDTTGIKREDVMGRDVLELEKEGLFKPSVYGIVIKEKRRISFLQEGMQWTAIATGAPIYDENGEIYRIVSNARDLNEIKEITSYVEKSEQTEEEADDRIIAESDSMKEILELARQIANVDSNILITGESGVGKGVLARFIHNHSYRKDGAFVEINCGAIPDTLLESELFGYESGAFTGADRKGKPGLIELAHKGTLFLDEIGELPMMLQVKLLSFLQNRRITRVGGTKERAVDVRVITATNQELSKMVAENRFRDDLFYRLHVVPIFIPPLRDRTEDIYPAACYFAQKFRDKYHKKFEFSDEFLETLLHYDWMGNMRELENYMERIVVMSGGETNSRLLEPIRDRSEKDSESNHLTLSEKLEKYEAELVKMAYANNPNTYKLAQALGISQPSASRKIKKYIKKT